MGEKWKICTSSVGGKWHVEVYGEDTCDVAHEIADSIAALESRLAEAELTLMGARDFLKLIAYYDFDPMDVRSSDAAEEIKKIDAALKKLGGKNA